MIDLVVISVLLAGSILGLCMIVFLFLKKEQNGNN